MKIEPTADHRVAAAACQQMFVALLDAQFTERQALAILGQMISQGKEGT
jgi:hypothetical protein